MGTLTEGFAGLDGGTVPVLDSQRLRYFVTLARALHFGRAAGELGITQPTLSQQIRVLEGEIGVPLLTRTKRDVSLTPAGSALYPRAVRLLQDMAEAAEQARRASQQVAGQLRIGYLKCDVPGHARELLTEFSLRFPDVRVETVLGGTGDRIELIRRSKIDAAILRMHTLTDERFKYRLLYREPLLVAVATTDPLGRESGPIPLEALDSYDLAVFAKAQNPQLYEDIFGALRDASVRMNVVREAWNEISILPFIAARGGVAFIAASKAAVLHYEGVRYRPLVGAPLSIGLGLAVPVDTASRPVDVLWDLTAEFEHIEIPE